MRMRVTERVDGNAGAEIQIAFALVGGQPRALAPHKGKVGTRKHRKQGGTHFVLPGHKTCGPKSAEAPPAKAAPLISTILRGDDDESITPKTLRNQHFRRVIQPSFPGRWGKRDVHVSDSCGGVWR